MLHATNEIKSLQRYIFYVSSGQSRKQSFRASSRGVMINDANKNDECVSREDRETQKREKGGTRLKTLINA